MTQKEKEDFIKKELVGIFEKSQKLGFFGGWTNYYLFLLCGVAFPASMPDKTLDEFYTKIKESRRRLKGSISKT